MAKCSLLMKQAAVFPLSVMFLCGKNCSTAAKPDRLENGEWLVASRLQDHTRDEKKQAILGVNCCSHVGNLLRQRRETLYRYKDDSVHLRRAKASWAAPILSKYEQLLVHTSCCLLQRLSMIVFILLCAPSTLQRSHRSLVRWSLPYLHVFGARTLHNRLRAPRQGPHLRICRPLVALSHKL